MDVAAQISLTRQEMETRRLEAAKELLNGVSQSKVGRKFFVSRTTASRWSRAISNAPGVEEALGLLKRRKATGRPNRLTPEQLTRVAEIYHSSPQTFGFTEGQWTTTRMAAVIESQFGVQYDRDHVGRMLNKLGLREVNHRLPQLPPATTTDAALVLEPGSGQPVVEQQVA